MLTVRDYAAVEGPMQALLKAGMATNALPNGDALRREIENGTLLMQECEEGLLLLRRRDGFDRLTYLLHRGASAPAFAPERTTVLEIPYRTADEKTAALSMAWEQQGFALALRRRRLTRKPCPMEGEAAMACADLEQANTILNTMFCARTACLPDGAELGNAMAEGRILMQNGGLLHFEVNGKTSELRHLAVLPRGQGKGTAKTLVQAYLALRGSGLCRVWTGEDNEAALHLYHSFGFAEDGWQSDVRIFERT